MNQFEKIGCVSIANMSNYDSTFEKFIASNIGYPVPIKFISSGIGWMIGEKDSDTDSDDLPNFLYVVKVISQDVADLLNYLENIDNEDIYTVKPGMTVLVYVPAGSPYYTTVPDDVGIQTMTVDEWKSKVSRTMIEILKARKETELSVDAAARELDKTPCFTVFGEDDLI